MTSLSEKAKNCLANNPSFPKDVDLLYYTIDYASSFFLGDEYRGHYTFEKLFWDGTFSLGEIFEASILEAGRSNDIEALKYFWESHPNFEIDIHNGSYSEIIRLIKNNSSDTLLYYIEKEKFHITEQFLTRYQTCTKNSYITENVATSIIDTCILNYQLEKILIHNLENISENQIKTIKNKKI